MVVRGEMEDGEGEVWVISFEVLLCFVFFFFR